MRLLNRVDFRRRKERNEEVEDDWKAGLFALPSTIFRLCPDALFSMFSRPPQSAPVKLCFCFVVIVIVIVCGEWHDEIFSCWSRTRDLCSSFISLSFHTLKSFCLSFSYLCSLVCCWFSLFLVYWFVVHEQTSKRTCIKIQGNSRFVFFVVVVVGERGVG